VLLFFLFAFPFYIRPVRPLVGLDIHEPALLIPDGIQFGSRSAAVSCSFGHFVSFLNGMIRTGHPLTKFRVNLIHPP
jgi:hypothetical protein